MSLSLDEIKDKYGCNITEETKYFVDYHHLDRLIQNVYGVDFEFCADQESSNDISHSFSIKKEEFSEWELKDIKNFAETGKYSFLSHTILTDLCNRDILPAGDYIVEVCW